jgi:hypothetical protein
MSSPPSETGISNWEPAMTRPYIRDPSETTFTPVRHGAAKTSMATPSERSSR